MPIEKIMLATNGSPHSEAALRFVLTGPLPRSAQVTVVTVDEKHGSGNYLSGSRAADLAREVSGRLAGTFGDGGVRTQILSGPPSDAILAQIKIDCPDLLVIGAHAPPDTLEDKIHGSVVTILAREAPTSVLIIRQTERAGIRRVLISLGEQARSKRVVEAVAGLPWPPAVQFKLMHVYMPPVSEYTPSPKRSIEFFQKARSEARLDSASLLNSLAVRLKEQLPHNTIDTVNLEDFFVAEDVLEIIKTWQADLVVLGPREHLGMDEVFLGSVTKQLLKAAPCSIFLVREVQRR